MQNIGVTASSTPTSPGLTGGSIYGEKALDPVVIPREVGVVCEHDQLQILIKSPADFKAHLMKLDAAQRALIGDWAQLCRYKVIQSGFHFGLVLEPLKAEQRTAYFETFRKHLPHIIDSAYDFKCALRYLNRAERSSVYEMMKVKLIFMLLQTDASTSAGYNLTNVLEYLKPEERTQFCGLIRDQMPELVKRGSDFGTVLAYVGPEQREVLCELLNEKLPELMVSGYYFGRMLARLSPEVCEEICHLLEGKLPGLIQTGLDFNDILKQLDSEQQAAVYWVFKPLLKGMVQSGDDFGAVLQYLSLHLRADVYEAFEDKLPDLICSGYQLGYSLKYLDVSLCQKLCNRLQDKLFGLTQSSHQMLLRSYLFLNLSREKRRILSATINRGPHDNGAMPRFTLNCPLRFFKHSVFTHDEIDDTQILIEKNNL